MHRKRAAIIGSGSIGIDLMYKAIRSTHLDLCVVVGRNKDSSGLAMAKEAGIETSHEGISYLASHINEVDIVFDATSAKGHLANNEFFKKATVLAIDMTPAKIGQLCVPSINLQQIESASNVNLVTCGGQASIPLAYTLSRAFTSLEYIEVASTIASNSAGMATRENINEYMVTTEHALEQFTGAKQVKAILNINPAKPGITMQTTVFAKGDYQDLQAVREGVNDMIERVRTYVPGYELVLEPVETKGCLALSVIVRGSGDYLPPYAGNLDIINCAAIAVAEDRVIKQQRSVA